MSKINNINLERNEGVCKCGHHSKDHSYSLAPKCADLECDKCNCQNYKFDKFKKEIIHIGNDNKCETCVKLGYEKACKEFGKMIDKTAKSYGDVVGFRILRQQLQELKSKEKK